MVHGGGGGITPMTPGSSSLQVGGWGAGRLHHRLHAFVKKALLHQLVPHGAFVCDLFCGRGTDTANWAQAEIGTYIGVDLSASALEEAREQWDQQGRPFPATFCELDPCTANLDSQLKDPRLPADVVSCLAHLQDCFTSEDMVRRFLKNVVSLLKPGGFFFGTTPDSSTIWYKYQKAVEEAMKVGNLRVNGTLPRVRSPLYTISFEDDRAGLGGIYGYRFHFYGSKYHLRFVDGLPTQTQLLVHFPSLIRLAEEVGLEYVEIQNLTEFYEDYRIPFSSILQSSCKNLVDAKGHPMVDARGRLSSVALDVLSLHSTFIFRKTKRPSYSEYSPLKIFPSNETEQIALPYTSTTVKQNQFSDGETKPEDSPLKKKNLLAPVLTNGEHSPNLVNRTTAPVALEEIQPLVDTMRKEISNEIIPVIDEQVNKTADADENEKVPMLDDQLNKTADAGQNENLETGTENLANVEEHILDVEAFREEKVVDSKEETGYSKESPHTSDLIRRKRSLRPGRSSSTKNLLEEAEPSSSNSQIQVEVELEPLILQDSRCSLSPKKMSEGAEPTSSVDHQSKVDREREQESSTLRLSHSFSEENLAEGTIQTFGVDLRGKEPERALEPSVSGVPAPSTKMYSRRKKRRSEVTEGGQDASSHFDTGNVPQLRPSENSSSGTPQPSQAATTETSNQLHECVADSSLVKEDHAENSEVGGHDGIHSVRGRRGRRGRRPAVRRGAKRLTRRSVAELAVKEEKVELEYIWEKLGPSPSPELSTIASRVTRTRSLRSSHKH